MPDRIIEIAEQPAHLSLDTGRLVVQPRGGPTDLTPLAEVGVVVLGHPQVTVTHAALSGLAENGAVVIACDGRRLPVGMLMPLQNHSTQTERLALQASASLPTRKRLWQQLVRAKIRAQARTLRAAIGDDGGLAALAARVRSGDAGNMEGVASRRYWPLLLGSDFRRDHERPGLNAGLNYGYALIRGVVSRAICAAGLHPSLGLHHHNRYNPFCLADDLMEPLRPLVDLRLAGWFRSGEFCGDGPDGSLTQQDRRLLLGLLLERVRIDGERRSLFDACARMAASLVAVLSRERRNLSIPEAISPEG